MRRIFTRKDWQNGALREALGGTGQTIVAPSENSSSEEHGPQRSSMGNDKYALLSVLLLGLFLVLGAGRAQATTLLDGLVAYWPFTGNALDATGNGHDGTVLGATLAADRFGNANSAYDFSGGDYINVAPDGQLQITGPLTINAWINYRSLPGNPRVISFGPDLHGYELLVGGGAFGTTPKQPVFFFGNKAVGSSTLLSANSWHMLTAVGIPDAGGGLQLWVDGVMAGDVSGGPTSFSYPGQMNIGRKAASAFDPWDGLIDDVMIYSRTLTASEIQTLYNLTATLPPPPPNVISEPGTLALQVGGLVAFGIARIRQRSQARL